MPPAAERRVLTLVIVLASAMVAQAFGRFTWGVVLPEARDDLLEGSNTAAGLFGSLNVGAYLIGTIAVAWLASRSSLVGLVKIGLVLSTSGLAIASFTTEPVVLAGALVLMGFGGAITWVPVPGIAARQFSAGAAARDRHRRDRHRCRHRLRRPNGGLAPEVAIRTCGRRSIASNSGSPWS